MRSATLWRATVLACVVSGLVACGRREEQAVESSGAIGVEVAAARIDTLRDVANASGTVVPSAAADWTVYASEDGQIVELPKKVDDPVAVGDVLVRFDIAALNQEQATLQLETMEATGRAERARAELSRQTALFERGIIARNVFDTSRLEASAAESALAQVKARASALAAGDDRAVVRARFVGVVTDVWHAVGDAVRPGNVDPIIRVVDPTRVQVAVQLPIGQLARVAPGQVATVRAIAAAADEIGTVVSKATAIDPSAPTGEVRIAFNTPATLPLNTPASVEILLDQRSGVLVVPATGIRRDDLGQFVVVVGDDNLARRRDVRVGLVGRDLAQVVTGLETGERIITSDLSDIGELTPVFVSR